MIGIDTNVLVRYIVRDDPVQTQLATHLIESLDELSPGFVSLIALVETIWVLEDRYAATRAHIAEVVGGLLASRELRIEQTAIVQKALARFRSSKADFADCLIERVGHASGCEHTATFDRKAAKVEGMRLLRGET